MVSAFIFLPSSIRRLMKRWASSEPNIGSGRMILFGVCPLRGMLLSGLRALGSVLAAALLAVGGAGGLLGSPHDVVADSREILDPSATDQDDAVLLEVVADAGDVGGDLDAIRQANTGDLAQGRVRLLGRDGAHDGADAALLRVPLERR